MTHAYGLDMFNEGRKRDKGLVFYSKRVTEASLVCRDSVTEKSRGPRCSRVINTYRAGGMEIATNTHSPETCSILLRLQSEPPGNGAG